MVGTHEVNERPSLGPEDVAVLMRAAGLPVERHRLEQLAALLDPALTAARTMGDAASRVPLADAATFDAAWTEEGSRS